MPQRKNFTIGNSKKNHIVREPKDGIQTMTIVAHKMLTL